jgi:hypothetical protein
VAVPRVYRRPMQQNRWAGCIMSIHSRLRSRDPVFAHHTGLPESSFEQKSGAGDTILCGLVRRRRRRAVARAGYRAMMRGRRVAIPGLVTKMLALAGELPPRRIALEVNRWLLSRRPAKA